MISSHGLLPQGLPERERKRPLCDSERGNGNGRHEVGGSLHLYDLGHSPLPFLLYSRVMVNNQFIQKTSVTSLLYVRLYLDSGYRNEYHRQVRVSANGPRV